MAAASVPSLPGDANGTLYASDPLCKHRETCRIWVVQGHRSGENPVTRGDHLEGGSEGAVLALAKMFVGVWERAPTHGMGRPRAA